MTEPDDHLGEQHETPEAPEVPPAHQPPVAPPTAPAAQPPAFAGQPYPPGYVASYPFAPVVKEPWFNPAKRTTILVVSIIAALVLLGGGILIGAASSSDHHDRERGFSSYGPMQGPGGVGPRFHVLPGPGKHPGRGNGPGNGPGSGPGSGPGNGIGNGTGQSTAPSSTQPAAPSGSTTTS